MVINCKQCNRAFKITDSEIEFYRRKGFDLPKRCKNCRDLNKRKKLSISVNNDNYTESYAKKDYFPIFAVIMTIIIIASVATTIYITANQHTVTTYKDTPKGPVTYYLNTYRHKFHETDCPSVQQMNPKNKKSFYGTREDAISRGYSPCHDCNP